MIFRHQSILVVNFLQFDPTGLLPANAKNAGVLGTLRNIVALPLAAHSVLILAILALTAKLPLAPVLTVTVLTMFSTEDVRPTSLRPKLLSSAILMAFPYGQPGLKLGGKASSPFLPLDLSLNLLLPLYPLLLLLPCLYLLPCLSLYPLLPLSHSLTPSLSSIVTPRPLLLPLIPLPFPNVLTLIPHHPGLSNAIESLLLHRQALPLSLLLPLLCLLRRNFTLNALPPILLYLKPSK